VRGTSAQLIAIADHQPDERAAIKHAISDLLAGLK
jgi:hypothetical protein